MSIRFYKKFLILSAVFSLSMLSTQEISAEEENYCLKGTPSFSLSACSYTKSTEPDASYINDNNVNTRVGAQCGGSPSQPYASSLDYDAIVMFDAMKTHVDRIEHVFEITGYGKITYTYLYYGGEWHQIDLMSQGGGPNLPKQTRTITGSWDDVEGVWMNVRAGGPGGGSYAYTYEIRAFGPPGPSYIDSGLRIRNASGQTVAIAAWPLGEEAKSPLRISRDGHIYGIVLIDPSDPEYANPQYDSGARIQTNSGIKSLRKYY